MARYDMQFSQFSPIVETLRSQCLEPQLQRRLDLFQYPLNSPLVALVGQPNSTRFDGYTRLLYGDDGPQFGKYLVTKAREVSHMPCIFVVLSYAGYLRTAISIGADKETTSKLLAKITTLNENMILNSLQLTSSDKNAMVYISSESANALNSCALRQENHPIDNYQPFVNKDRVHSGLAQDASALAPDWPVSQPADNEQTVEISVGWPSSRLDFERDAQLQRSDRTRTQDRTACIGIGLFFSAALISLPIALLGITNRFSAICVLITALFGMVLWMLSLDETDADLDAMPDSARIPTNPERDQ